MARFQFDATHRLPRSLTRPARRVTPSSAGPHPVAGRNWGVDLDLGIGATPEAATDVDTDAAPSAGPGWFDSSWDLIRGLEVEEAAHDSAEQHWRQACQNVDRLPAARRTRAIVHRKRTRRSTRSRPTSSRV
jgi:hypothetical protein